MRWLLALALTTTLHAQVNTTEVWVGKFDAATFTVSKLTNVSNHAGYDNQPTFLPDGNSLIYTSQVGDMAETGQGVEAVLVDLRTGAVTPTRVRGFSPTPFEGGLLVLREGDVWKHALTGGEGVEMTAVDRAGYFTRFDERTWVLFMNDEQRRIAIYDAKTKALETVATGAITAPYRVPGARAVTFVTATDDARTLHRLDLATKKVTALSTIPFKTGGHHVWTARGSLLMASGNAIHEWKDGWKEVWRTDHPDLQSISRIALSPNADRIALVSVPRDETVIRDARTLGSERRIPERIDVGRDTASEQGRWEKGRYMAVWKMTVTGSGTRSWKMEQELLATLE
jgi:hypothetical protein